MDQAAAAKIVDPCEGFGEFDLRLEGRIVQQDVQKTIEDQRNENTTKKTRHD